MWQYPPFGNKLQRAEYSGFFNRKFPAAQIELFSRKNLNNFVSWGSFAGNYFNHFKFVSDFT